MTLIAAIPRKRRLIPSPALTECLREEAEAHRSRAHREGPLPDCLDCITEQLRAAARRKENG